MGKILMCGSFKGGVGKTASSWNLAYSLAEKAVPEGEKDQ